MIEGADVTSVTLALCAVIVLLAAAHLRKRVQGGIDYDQDRARLLHIAIYVAGALAWPLIYNVALASCGLDASASDNKVIVQAVSAIPALLLIGNAMLAPNRKRHGKQRHDDVKNNAVLLGGVVFTAAMLMSNGRPRSRGRGAAKLNALEACKNKLLGIVLVSCVLLVLPTPDVDRSTYHGTLLTTVQNTIMSYAIGLFGIAYVI